MEHENFINEVIQFKNYLLTTTGTIKEKDKVYKKTFGKLKYKDAYIIDLINLCKRWEVLDVDQSYRTLHKSLRRLIPKDIKKYIEFLTYIPGKENENKKRHKIRNR